MLRHFIDHFCRISAATLVVVVVVNAIVIAHRIQFLVQRRVMCQPAQVKEILDALLAEDEVVLEIDESLWVKAVVSAPRTPLTQTTLTSGGR